MTYHRPSSTRVPTNSPEFAGLRVDAELLREVRRIERDRILLELRDAIDRIPVIQQSHNSYTSTKRYASDFQSDAIVAINALKAKP